MGVRFVFMNRLSRCKNSFSAGVGGEERVERRKPGFMMFPRDGIAFTFKQKQTALAGGVAFFPKRNDSQAGRQLVASITVG